MIAKLISVINGQAAVQKQIDEQRRMIRAEAQIGGQLFGPLPEEHRREFFCLDEHTWIWHEEWLDPSGQRLVKSTRYDIRPNGIYKVQDGGSYQSVGAEEANNLKAAAVSYQERVRTELYGVS